MAASEPVCVQDFELFLKGVVPQPWWEYYRSGYGCEQTLRDNPLAYQRYRLRPRCLRDVSKRDTSTSILGHRLEFPVCVSPSACHGVVHPDGEIATAKAVASVGSAMVLSMWSNKSLEDVAAAVPPETPLFQHVNSISDTRSAQRLVKLMEILVRRAGEAGYKAIVLTVDQPVLSPRTVSYKDERTVVTENLQIGCQSFVGDCPAFADTHFILLGGEASAVEHFAHGYDTWFPQIFSPGVPSDLMNYSVLDPTLTWDDIGWLRGLTSLPIVLKGITTAEAAKEAVRRGVDAILVSNHGGRELDGRPATIDILPEVVKAVRGSNVEVYLDGGIRTGTDVLKALALGARAVFIGRPALWGLAYKGEAGVRQVLQILQEEFSTAMALTGCSSLADITPDLIAMPPYSKL